jgi:hypothetical protein
MPDHDTARKGHVPEKRRDLAGIGRDQVFLLPDAARMPPVRDPLAPALPLAA